MKMLRMIFYAVIVLLIPVYAVSADGGYMRIGLIEGDVQVKTPDADEWGLASVNGPLMEGDQIWVPAGGRVELQLNTGTFVRLDQNSALQVLSLGTDSSQFFLSQGHAYVYFEAPRGSVIQVDSADASTRAFDAAVFRIDMSDQYEYTEVAVYRGYVESENRIGKTRVNAGEMLSVGQDTNGEVAPMGPPDAWEQWNKSRNDIIRERRGSSSRNLPPDLRAYSYDLDANGRWSYVPDYGNVWIPTVGVTASWAPYREGRWIWRGGDYVWVSHDPWGWAPYHYGRWAFIDTVGWFWVPPVAGDVYWSPGYVGWVRTGDYVAWVPLAPGELYYGHGYYGRQSVNITNVNVTQVNVTNVYKNVNVNNGVTVVNRNTFATARPTVANVNKTVVQQQIFTKNNFMIGGPAIRPTKESYFATAKQVPPAKLPPQPVRNLQVKELKQARPLIKEPEKSVLNPGAKVQKLPVNTVTTKRTPGKEIPTIQPAQPGGRALPGGPAPKGEKPQVRLPERKPFAPALPGGKPQVTPPAAKPAAPADSSAPRGERPQVTPPERKAVTPEGTPPPRGGKPQVTPPERKAVTPEGTPPPRGGKPQVTPPERKAVTPEGTPPPRGGKPQVTPPERKAVTPEGTPPPRGGRPQVTPPERKAVTPEGTPPPRGGKPQVTPPERKAVTPEGTPPPRGGKPQVTPPERKAVTPEGGPPPHGEKPQVAPQEKKPATPAPKKTPPVEKEEGPGQKKPEEAPPPR